MVICLRMCFCVRGVIRVDVNIQSIDLDQCARGDGWFADTHKCNRTTMEVKKKQIQEQQESIYSVVSVSSTMANKAAILYLEFEIT